jgi:hypothetical protein
MEFHRLLHGSNEILLPLGIEGSDVVPCVVQIFNVLLDFGLVWLSANLHQVLTSQPALVNLGLGLVDVALDLLQHLLLLFDGRRFDCRWLLRLQGVLQVLEGLHDLLQLLPELLGNVEGVVQSLATVIGGLLHLTPQLVELVQLVSDVWNTRN